MEIGMLFKWGKPVAGRERQAIDLFTEVKEWIDGQYKKGFVTYYEPYLYMSGDLETELGFYLVKGEREKLFQWMDDDTFRWFLVKAQFLVDHFQFHWLTVGEAIPTEIERTEKFLAEFAPVG